MMKKKWLIVLAVVFCGYFVLKHTALYAAKKVVEKKWSEIFPVELKIGHLNYSILRGVGSVHGIVIQDGKEPIVQVQKVAVNLDWLPLLRKQASIAIDVRHPQLFLRKQGEKTNIAKLMGPLQQYQKQAAAKKEREPAQALPLAIHLRRVHVDNFEMAYLEKFPKTSFQYTIDEGQFLFRDFKYPGETKSP